MLSLTFAFRILSSQFILVIYKTLKMVRNSVDGYALLMREFRGEWPDWLKLTGRLQ